MSDEIAVHFVLSKPIQTPAGEITDHEFREPRGADLVAVGNPVIFEPSFSPPRMTHNAVLMNDMMGRLSNTPPPFLAQMQPEDWVSIAWALTPFFVPMRRGGSSSSASA